MTVSRTLKCSNEFSSTRLLGRAGNEAGTGAQFASAAAAAAAVPTRGDGRSTVLRCAFDVTRVFFFVVRMKGSGEIDARAFCAAASVRDWNGGRGGDVSRALGTVNGLVVRRAADDYGN